MCLMKLKDTREIVIEAEGNETSSSQQIKTQFKQ